MLRRGLLHLFYYTLHSLVRIWLWLYYREIRVEGFPARVPKGPLLVLSNHPNAMMDPYLIVSRLYRKVFFLANAGLFRHPFANWFLNTFYCIPIERPKDVDRPIDNADSFRRSREHLEAGGALYIAPEGSCYREYRLRPLKTGAARIALDLLRSGKVKELHILMAGVVYADPPAFRSRLAMRFAPVFTLRREDLQGDITDWGHVAELTLQLRHTMESLLPHGGEALDAALTRAAGQVRPALQGRDWMERLFAMHGHLQALGDGAGAWVDGLESLLGEKDLAHLDPDWLVGRRLSTLRFILTLPLAGLVLAHFPLLFGLAEWIRRRLGADMVYDATVRYLAALVLLPLNLWLWLTLLPDWPAPVKWGYVLGLLVLGPLAWQEMRAWRDHRAHDAFGKAARQDPDWHGRLERHLRPLSGARP